MRVLLLSILCSVIALSQQQENPKPWDEHWLDHVQACLAENQLHFSIFGVSRIANVLEPDMKNLATLAADKRGCLVACIYKKQGVITEEGVLQENPPHPDPTTKFETTFEDAIAACRSEKDFCKLGNCLFEIYFNYEI